MINSPDSNKYHDLLNGSPNISAQEPSTNPETTALDELYAVARTAAQAVRRERERILRARLQERLAEIVASAEEANLWAMVREIERLHLDLHNDLTMSVRDVPTAEGDGPSRFQPRT